MNQGLDFWHWKCNYCKYESSNLDSGINEIKKHLLINENERANGLKILRDSNFRVLIRWILRQLPEGKHTLLEVGAGHGWFIKIASEYFHVLGVEPDNQVLQDALPPNCSLIEGYFPEVLENHQRFDVIVFNDVFEHIIDVKKIITDCKMHLNKNGLLVLNLPSSLGFFYRIAKLLKHCGFSGPFERLWQKDFPSPHLHYFAPKNLIPLVEKNGFETIFMDHLPSIRKTGLYNRISHVNNQNKSPNKIIIFFMYLMVLLAIPLLKLFKSDIVVLIFRKE